MAKEQEKKQDTSKKEETPLMRYAKIFFYVAPLVGIVIGAIYLSQQPNDTQDGVCFSPGEFKNTVVRIIEKSQDEEGLVDMKKVEQQIEATIKAKQPEKKK